MKKRKASGAASWKVVGTAKRLSLRTILSSVRKDSSVKMRVMREMRVSSRNLKYLRRVGRRRTRVRGRKGILGIAISVPGSTSGAEPSVSWALIVPKVRAKQRRRRRGVEVEV